MNNVGLAEIGNSIILPLSCVGCPRHRQEYIQRDTYIYRHDITVREFTKKRI